MRLLAALAMLGLFALPASAQMDDSANRIFPYDYEVRDLDNGLRVVVIPTDFPNIVSLQIPVSTGSRNEVEEGKSGFAHFFEHMMFRGTENYTADEYGDILKNAGADQNAYTTDDRTLYHITFSKEDLETVLMLEADRFQHLQYSEADFRTEALAVLGEYNKNSANPTSKLFEVQRAAAFNEHTYRHTTMGFLDDCEDMPNALAYSHEFFRRYYRPANSGVIVAGDVAADPSRAVEHPGPLVEPAGKHNQPIHFKQALLVEIELEIFLRFHAFTPLSPGARLRFRPDRAPAYRFARRPTT